MTELSNESWMVNIENAACEVAAGHPNGDEIVEHVLNNYGAESIEDIAPSDYAEVYDELDYIATDLRH